MSGQARAQVDDVQRGRILTAMFEAACEHGAGNVNVGHVVERSGISRRTFYEQFGNRDECFAAAFEQASTCASERVLAAYETEACWRERIRAGLVALLIFLDEQPKRGRVLICESLTGGAQVLARRNEILSTLVRAVDRGRCESKGGPGQVPPLAAEGVVGGVLAVISTRLAEEAHESLVGLANQLMSMIVLPYMGASAARRELDRPVPVRDNTEHEGPGLSGDPFKAAGMRLTYRTVRVLIAVADNPGTSNRLIGEVAGMGDQGQISKLLGRLERIGLIANSGRGPGSGAPNSWTVTSTGRQIVSSFQIHTQAAQR